jgi:CDGSH-type Zn-finger protein
VFSCGTSSKKQPFCDGSHKGTDFTPFVYKAEGNKKNVFFVHVNKLGNATVL